MRKKAWIQQVASCRSELEGVPLAPQSELWWKALRDILDVFQGNELVLQRIAREDGVGWIELVSVWGLWGDDQLERQHLP